MAGTLPEPGALDDVRDAAVGTDRLEPEVVPAPSGLLITDFESWDGSAPANGWTFQFGSPAQTGTLSEVHDNSGGYAIEFVEGYESSTALAVRSEPTVDGERGVAFTVTTIDAAASSGISFRLRGSGGREIALSVETVECRDDCSVATAIQVRDRWELLEIPWSVYLPTLTLDGGSHAPPGTGIVRLRFLSWPSFRQNASGDWVTRPREFEITLDDLRLY